MSFETFFRIVSYGAVFCGFLALWVSGSFGIVETAGFIALMIVAWRMEGSRWQISEKVGTALIVLALPAFFVAWKFRIITFAGGEAAIAGILARMILSLAAIKLLQKKSDRDWIFLYLMSFFEVLLAAGLSISPLYFGAFVVYMLVIACSIIAFEIRKTSRAVELKIAGDKTYERDPNSESKMTFPVRRLPAAAVALVVFIVALALPMFFLLPRVGGAGFGGNQFGQRTSSGFSDTVRLGGIGQIQQSEEVVMRVKLEGSQDDNLYFRGVALDTFDNKSWSKSNTGTRIAMEKNEGDLVQVDFTKGSENRTVQTVYLEPLDTPVLFALPRAVSIQQGNFPVVYKDAYGGFSYPRTFERVSYKVFSDRSVPTAAELRADDRPYIADVSNYRFLPPNLDPRIAKLAEQITAKTKNRYDKARAVESYLQNNFGYTLEQKSGGEEPLADFLFNVREGHCEYFATAMAVMLRTQGIATRIVNGFHGGEYNDAADVTVVRQRNAHAWVEVYFPGQDAWVTFDPTPFAGQTAAATSSSGIVGSVRKYLEALETFWIQHFVAYDDQEQRSLAKSVRNSFMNYQAGISSYLNYAQGVMTNWWKRVRGDEGLQTSISAISYGVAYLVAGVLGILLIVWLFRKVKRLGIWQNIWDRIFKKRHASIVEFYERMQRILAEKGWTREPHQTPLEFAFASGIPEVVSITERYNRVRFGEKNLSRDEADEIESWLKTLKAE